MYRRVLSDVIDLIKGRWVLPILGALEESPLRYMELLRAVGGVSERVFTETLHRMERDGLIRHNQVQFDAHLGGTYELTDLARGLLQALEQPTKWGEQHAAELQEIKARRLQRDDQ